MMSRRTLLAGAAAIAGAKVVPAVAHTEAAAVIWDRGVPIFEVNDFAALNAVAQRIWFDQARQAICREFIDEKMFHEYGAA